MKPRRGTDIFLVISLPLTILYKLYYMLESMVCFRGGPHALEGVAAEIRPTPAHVALTSGAISPPAGVSGGSRVVPGW